MTADVAVNLNSDVLSLETSQPSTSTFIKKGKEKPPPEYCVLLVGTNHKQPLFEKLLSSADKFERHIQYQDTFYLYVNIQGAPAVIELNDPGIEHTGAREMAVRKAEAIILCYAAYNAASFHQLSSIAEDFKSRKTGSPPVLLICNEDEIIEDNEEVHAGASHSSTSEGYESFEEHAGSTSPIHRRPSMENIRKSREEHCPITSEQGENMAQLFGPECEFLSVSFSSFQGSAQLLNKLITRIKSRESEKERGRPKERSQSILKIKRRRSIPHPLKFFTNHSEEDKSSPKKNCRSKKNNKVAHQDHSSSSSRESIEKGFLGAISSPPRRSKSVNVQGHNSEKQDTRSPIPVGDGGSKGTAKSKISKRISGSSGNKAEESDLHSNPSSSPTSLYQRHTKDKSPRSPHIGNAGNEFGNNQSPTATTPTSLNVHRLRIEEKVEEIRPEAPDNILDVEEKERRNSRKIETSEKKNLAASQKKKKSWSFRKVSKGSGEKSAACIIS